jgi:ABC-type transport system involved in cytochrome bd biosynthesis fused ATPase/permease subunit
MFFQSFNDNFSQIICIASFNDISQNLGRIRRGDALSRFLQDLKSCDNILFILHFPIGAMVFKYVTTTGRF